MRKKLFTVAVTVLLLMQALPALADYNEIHFYLNNNSSKAYITMEVKGIENIDFYDTRKTCPGSDEHTSAEATAWFISWTTYRWEVTLYRGNSTDMEYAKLAKYTLKCVNYYLLYPAISEFTVEEETVYEGDFSFSTYTRSDGSAKFTIDANVD